MSQCSPEKRALSVPLRVLIARFDVAAADPVVRLTLTQWGRLLALVLPEAYADAGVPAGPTATLPGTVARRAVLAARAALGLSLQHPLDAPLDAAACDRAPSPRIVPAGGRPVGQVRRKRGRWYALVQGRCLPGSWATRDQAEDAVAGEVARLGSAADRD